MIIWEILLVLSRKQTCNKVFPQLFLSCICSDATLFVTNFGAHLLHTSKLVMGAKGSKPKASTDRRQSGKEASIGRLSSNSEKSHSSQKSTSLKKPSSFKSNNSRGTRRMSLDLLRGENSSIKKRHNLEQQLATIIQVSVTHLRNILQNGPTFCTPAPITDVRSPVPSPTSHNSSLLSYNHLCRIRPR